MRPRQLVAEFAIVTADDGWAGYRDVVQVGGKKVRERSDRLLSLFTSPSADTSEIRRIAEENAPVDHDGTLRRGDQARVTTAFSGRGDNAGRLLRLQAVHDRRTDPYSEGGMTSAGTRT